ncbi:hypothetical protein F0562_033922 [Nyssa sinensis]|uniref:FBD domain-containing protein n=1 Tax=Nyssa sinensis TaxID=561372 RepID=A0A5J5AGD5_9ASTE|nr:hypothetical protein F0562_033922 [Nyssa sinensis]
MYNLDEVMSCMPRVEKLYMNNFTLKVLAAGGVPKRLATTPNLLKILGLIFINFHDVDQISCAFCLIRSSLNLEKLVIWAPTSAVAAMDPVLNFMEKHDCADDTLNKLREVKMQGVRGWKAELEFIKYILACSPKLELLNIVRCKDIDANAESRMSRELMRYPRASPKAEPPFISLISVEGASCFSHCRTAQLNQQK